MECGDLRAENSGFHTAEFDPCIKSQLASRNQLEGEPGGRACETGPKQLYQIHDLNWLSPESGGLWHKSRRLKKTIWWNLANALVGVILGAGVLARVQPGLPTTHRKFFIDNLLVRIHLTIVMIM